MNWKDVIKMPPIPNPRRDRTYPNDGLSMKEYEELFEEVVDPEIIISPPTVPTAITFPGDNQRITFT